MKAVIIGGGIAGLAIGIYLRRKYDDVVICERSTGVPAHGHAFLMHNEGKGILNELRGGTDIKLPGSKIETFSLRRPSGTEIKHLKLDHWKCIKRSDLTKFLYALFPKENILYDRTFSHFLFDGNRAVAAVFANGDVEYGDIFIGADGSQSKVRQSIFGDVEFTPVTVKEVVGTVTLPDDMPSMASTFAKFQHDRKGLAFGMIPTAPREYVWFMQFNPAEEDLPDSSASALQDFCTKKLRDFPAEVQSIMKYNNFETTYVWRTTDFDLLPKFHKENVVLIGDAAHLALPFTSTGTTNALLDARAVFNCLIAYPDCNSAFTAYYRYRAADVAQHIQAGRELNELFRNPERLSDDEIPVPLIPPKIQNDVKKAIQVLYFTDPVCSTCWIIQPLLRKLHLEYGKYLDIKYCMGGLLPSWENYNRGQIRQPSDAARHWEDVCRKHEMPLDGDVWYEDPLPSSFPPSIAFKAAQMQDTDKAIVFLRRIKEMLFLEKKNIIKWEYLERAAFETGLDSARLKRDFEGRAQDLFRADLELASDLDVRVFPTLIFSNGKDQISRLAGYHPYERYENIILKHIPGAVKEPIRNDPHQLFDTFYSMTDKEYSVILDITPEEARDSLMHLFEEGLIEKHESKNGIIWTKKTVDI